MHSLALLSSHRYKVVWICVSCISVKLEKTNAVKKEDVSLASVVQ